MSRVRRSALLAALALTAPVFGAESKTLVLPLSGMGEAGEAPVYWDFNLDIDGLLRQNIAPKTHPALIASGVSLLDIMNFNGLTIFSKNGRATWTGDSGAPGSSLGPTQAPQIPFEWHNGTPTYPMTLNTLAELPALLTGPQGAGAGKIGMTTPQWLQVAN